jgi:hypothetical protein
MRELAGGLVARGHTVDVVTTSIVDLEKAPQRFSHRFGGSSRGWSART